LGGAPQRLLGGVVGVAVPAVSVGAGVPVGVAVEVDVGGTVTAVVGGGVATADGLAVAEVEPPPTPACGDVDGDDGAAPWCAVWTSAKALIGTGTVYRRSNAANGAPREEARRMPGMLHQAIDCRSRLPAPPGLRRTIAARSRPRPATYGPTYPSTMIASTSAAAAIRRTKIALTPATIIT
jgi:hypothetical protein